MCITMRVAWLTIDRLRSGRDIRLSTATMRALNSRRPRSPSVHERLVPPRPILCFFLLLCVLQGARARSVPHDDDVVVVDRVHGKISATVQKASDSNLDAGATRGTAADDANDEEVRGRSLTENVGHDEGNKDDSDVIEGDLEERLVGEPEKIQIDVVANEGSVAKKRRRNDVSLVGSKSAVLQDGEDSPQKDGIRRFDFFAPMSGEEDGARPEEEKLEDVASSTEKTDLSEETAGQVKNPAVANVDEKIDDRVDEEVRNDLRSLELGDTSKSEGSLEERVVDEVAAREETAAKDPDVNRENRHLTGAPGKSKYKSSTVYLSAEEGGSPGRDQESIVDGQIKKLISIRDDALVSAGDGAKPAEKLDEEEAALLSGKSVGIDVTGAEENEEVRNQRSNSDTKDTSVPAENLEQPSLATETAPSRLQLWRNQVAMLQEQIKNRTFLQYLREQATEVLPDMPKFTEGQLLETLKNIWYSRAKPSTLSNETFSASLNTSALSLDQLEIIKCAEQLMEMKQRQTFVENMSECIRGLSVLNCLRIFVWPVVLDNMPESVKVTLGNLPIEINIMDLFQRAKTARSEGSAHRPRLLTPETVVFAILKNALDSKTTYDQAPAYIDFRNDTLRRLLTIGQLQILQMAERLLPGEARREYSDRMFSCVRRFEYFSCVKYFAWPMVRQYHSDLPDFPDYQTWYPTITTFYPQYPIIPFPSFVESSGELPEVVDADDSRMTKPKLEAVIVNILQNTLREHAKVPPPNVAHIADSYVTLLPPEQLLSIRMAEQLLPSSYRPEFVQKTVKCIQDFNYMTCIRYSIWPSVRQSTPSLPDITSWFPSFPSFPQVFGSYIPNISDYIPSFITGLGGGGATPSTEQSPQSGDSTDQVARFPTILYRQHEISSKASNELENMITEILTRVRNSLKAIPENSQLIISGNVIVLTTITDKQVNILKLAESIVPPPVRAPLINQVLSCLQTSNDFINCTRQIVWPTMAFYVSNLPEFPSLPPNQQSPEQESQQTLLKDKNTSHQINEERRAQWHNSQNAANPNVKIVSRTKYPQSNGPVISVTGTRFVPIFTEHPESVILNILRSIQFSSPNAQDDQATKDFDAQQFADDHLFNDQQENILRATENLLPETARPSFIERMVECVRKDSFLVCSREVLWPTLSEYFPRLPNFPNFGAPSQATDNKPTSPQNLTDTSPFSETDVKVGQHGDATVTITDTRFFPIFTEHPEGVILNILRAVQHATLGPLNPMISSRSPEIMSYFTEQQSNIVQVAESLLPESVRPVFIERMVTCVRESTFLECTRDITWPTIAQFFPRLPNFPNFGGSQSSPRAKLDLSSILLRNDYSENQQPDEKVQDIPKSVIDNTNDKTENVLKGLTDKKDASARFFPIFTENPEGVILNILRTIQYATPNSLNAKTSSSLPEIALPNDFTKQQVNIVQVAESLLPEPARPVFAQKMTTCVREYSFLVCVRDVAWPTIAQFFPQLPNFPNFGNSRNSPRIKKPGLPSVLLRRDYSENYQPNEKVQNIPNSAMESAEDKIENVLKELVSKKDTSARLENSYLDTNNPVIGNLLTAREMNIVKLTEKAIPDFLRRAYVTNMLECVRSNNFITCTQHISWPTLKQFAPTIPGFDQLFGQLPGLDQIPGVGQIPDFGGIAGQIPDFAGQIPSFPGVGQIPGFPGGGSFADLPSQITGIPGAIQGGFPGGVIPPGAIQGGFPSGVIPPGVIPGGIPGGTIPSGIQDGLSQFPGVPQFPSLGGFGFPSYARSLSNVAPEIKPQEETVQPRPQLKTEQTKQISGVSVAANTPSVEGAVSGYLGQPSSILIDISKEKVHLSDIEQQRGPLPESVPLDQSSTKRERRRRSAEQLSDLYSETDGEATVEQTSATMDSEFPNITESEFLQLLVNISRSKATLEEKPEETKTEYFVDTLNSTIRDSLTADQYEILKIVESLNEKTTSRGFLNRLYRCISSLNFIRCMRIFVGPMLGFPSFGGLGGLGGLGFRSIGRSTESEVENFFGMSTGDFEEELLARKESAENILLDWYKKLMEDKFQANIGFLKVKGYGNGEIGISFSSFREGRATKIKDNKNLPSILTIISDIMEEVLDQRPDNEKMKKEKEKRERSLDDVQETDFQLLKESDEYADIKRSINDDQIITMFLDKIKANASDFAEGDVTQYLNMEDAYNAFSVLFGTRLNDKFASRLKAFTEEHLRSSKKENLEDQANESNVENLKATSSKEDEEASYDLEKESTESQEERKREHRAKSDFKSLLSKYSDKYARNIVAARVDDLERDNKIKDTASESSLDKDTRSELRLQLPRLREDVISRKITSTVMHFGRALKMKMSTMLPGIGFVISFLIQTALAHARAAATMAGMISNMAFASAMFGMLRQSLLGSDNPKVKYVYDNDKTGPGITWPNPGTYHHHGK